MGEMETNKRMGRKVSFEIESSDEEKLRKWKGEMEKEYNKLREE